MITANSKVKTETFRKTVSLSLVTAFINNTPLQVKAVRICESLYESSKYIPRKIKDAAIYASPILLPNQIQVEYE